MFDASYNLLAIWGSGSSGNGQFSFPNSVAVDSQGHVYVTDLNNHRVQKFGANGNWDD
jgi:DNA-binding beta-propeller fold protein YncE